MKKAIFLLAICLGFSLSLNSCKDKEHKHSEKTHIHDNAEEGSNEKELASNSLYQCPMNCEKGKSYIKEGSCPVCKMNLKPKEVDMDSDVGHKDDHDTENHDHNESEHSKEHN